MALAIGIDLGTTNSVVACVKDEHPFIVPNLQGGRTTPSVVGFHPTQVPRVGQLARQQSAINPANTIHSIKRFMGRRISEVHDEALHVPYALAAGRNDRVEIVVPAAGRNYTPEEISALILTKLQADISVFL